MISWQALLLLGRRGTRPGSVQCKHAPPPTHLDSASAPVLSPVAGRRRRVVGQNSRTQLSCQSSPAAAAAAAALASFFALRITLLLTRTRPSVCW